MCEPDTPSTPDRAALRPDSTDHASPETAATFSLRDAAGFDGSAARVGGRRVKSAHTTHTHPSPLRPTLLQTPLELAMAAAPVKKGTYSAHLIDAFAFYAACVRGVDLPPLPRSLCSRPAGTTPTT